MTLTKKSIATKVLLALCGMILATAVPTLAHAKESTSSMKKCGSVTTKTARNDDEDDTTDDDGEVKKSNRADKDPAAGQADWFSTVPAQGS